MGRRGKREEREEVGGGREEGGGGGEEEGFEEALGGGGVVLLEEYLEFSNLFVAVGGGCLRWVWRGFGMVGAEGFGEGDRISEVVESVGGEIFGKKVETLHCFLLLYLPDFRCL